LIGPDYQIQTEVPSNRWIANPTGAIGIIILHQLPKVDGRRGGMHTRIFDAEGEKKSAKILGGKREAILSFGVRIC
jgi:hypothetical protein